MIEFLAAKNKLAVMGVTEATHHPRRGSQPTSTPGVRQPLACSGPNLIRNRLREFATCAAPGRRPNSDAPFPTCRTSAAPAVN